jgi:hypothetical protein
VIDEFTDHVAVRVAESTVPFFISPVVVSVALVGRELPLSETLTGPVTLLIDIPLILLDALNLPFDGLAFTNVHVLDPLSLDS